MNSGQVHGSHCEHNKYQSLNFSGIYIIYIT